MKKKKAKRKSATKKALSKTPKKKPLPDLVKGVYCIALGDSVYIGGRFVPARDLPGSGIPLKETGDKKTVSDILKALQAEADDSGIDDGIASAKVVPLSTFFMSSYEVNGDGLVEVSLACIDSARPFRSLVKNYRNGFRDDRREFLAEFKDAERNYYSQIKRLNTEQAKLEKAISKYT